jgi:hypothetical protein
MLGMMRVMSMMRTTSMTYNAHPKPWLQAGTGGTAGQHAPWPARTARPGSASWRQAGHAGRKASWPPAMLSLEACHAAQASSAASPSVSASIMLHGASGSMTAGSMAAWRVSPWRMVGVRGVWQLSLLSSCVAWWGQCIFSYCDGKDSEPEVRRTLDWH